MTAEEIAAKLSAGAKRACLRMTGEFQFPGKATFDANGAHALHWARKAGGRGSICERENLPDGKYKRAAFRLTPLGQQVRSILEGTSHAD